MPCNEFSLQRKNVCIVGDAVNGAVGDIPNKQLLSEDFSSIEKFEEKLICPHITLFSKNLLHNSGIDCKEALEFAKECFDEFQKIQPKINLNWIDLGTGKAENAYFKVICWPLGQIILWRFAQQRKVEYNLKDFHITIGFNNRSSSDVHHLRKNLSSIVPGLELFSVDKVDWILEQIKLLYADWENYLVDEKKARRKIFIEILSDAVVMCQHMMTLSSSKMELQRIEKSLFDVLALRSLLYGAENDLDQCMNDSQMMIKLDSLDPLGYARLGEVYSSLKVLDESFKNFSKALKLLSNENYDEQKNLRNRIEKGLKRNMNLQIFIKIDPTKRFAVNFVDSKTFQYRKETLARNFSWVVPGQLAGMSLPCTKEQIEALSHINIRMIFTVMDESKLSSEFFDYTGIQNVHYPVKNYKAPTIEQVDSFIEKCEKLLMNQNSAALVHCGGGKGRAGTFLACWLVKHGKDIYFPSKEKDIMSAADAISYLREIRPESVETKEQEYFIAEYSQILWKRFQENDEDEKDAHENSVTPERKKVRNLCAYNKFNRELSI
jgi:tetratricopeptide (TPR) repeat protein